MDSESKATILIVDDSPDSIVLLSSLLKSNYRIKVAISGDKALAIAAPCLPISRP
jgi:putative two-component system response regulator